MTGKEIVDHKGLQKLGIRFCKVHLMRLMEADDFPQAFKLGKHRNSPLVWWLSEIIAWLEACAAKQPKL